MTNIKSHLDKTFIEGTARLSSKIAGRVCEYRLEAMGYTLDEEDEGKTGECRILGVHCSPKLDHDIYHLQDIATKKEFSVSQCEVWLKNIDTLLNPE